MDNHKLLISLRGLDFFYKIHINVKHEFCTQDGYDYVSSQYFYRSPGYEVEGSEYVSGMDQRVTRGCVGGLELHGQRPEAALRGAFKSLTVLQQGPVQMEADIGLETLREAFQHLGKRKGGRSRSGIRDKELR